MAQTNPLIQLRSYNNWVLSSGLLLLASGLLAVMILNTTNWWDITLMVLGGLVLAVFLAANMAEVKAAGKKRSTVVRANLTLVAVAMLGIVVGINYIVSRHPLEVDLTSNKVNTLSDQTINLLKQLKQPVEVSMITSAKASSGEIQKAQDLLRKYAKYSDKFTFKTVDGDKNPAEVRKLNINRANTVVFISGDVRKDVLQQDYVVYSMMGRQPVPKFQGEAAFTSALLRMVDQTHKVFYFTEGHGEREFRSPQPDGLKNLIDLLEKENFTVNNLNFLTAKKVPDDADVIGILGPQKPFQPAEVEMVRAYLKKGGKVVLCVDPMVNSGLEAVLADFGLKLDNDFVVDTSQFYPPDPRNIIPTYMGHSIVEMLNDNHIYSVMPFVRSMRKVDPALKGATQTLVLQTSATAYGMTNFKAKDLQKGPKDPAGPLDVAYACEYPLPDNVGKKARLVAFGGSYFLTNNSLQAPGNGDLAVNAFSWAAEDEKKISIHPKEEEQRMVNLTSVGEKLMFVLFVLLVPVGTLVTGTVIWFRRRSL